MQSRTVRLFLSSTFRDFNEERGLLVQQVFPTLRARLRSRFVELVDIDLRWGIPAEEAEQGKVLSICLDEIDQCRPFFIGLLGERYGWVPPRDGYPAQLAEGHPWLADHRGVASVTELEIRYGVLDNPNMRSRALFFFRDPSYAERRGGAFLPTDADRLRQAALKDRIQASGLPVFDYGEPRDLAALLERQLWSLLDTEFPAGSVPDAHELENLSHSSFAATKLGPRFVEDRDLKQSLCRVLEAGHQRVLVSGPVGVGKSTLLADWLRDKVPAGTLVLSHFLEAGDESASAINLVRRLVEMIRHKTGGNDPIPEDRAGLLKSLPHWLALAHVYAQAKQARWLIVLDGMDRLRTERELLWLPTFFPESVRVIASSRPGTLQKALKRRGKWEVLELQLIPPERRRTLLEGQLAVFKKRLEEPRLQAILRHPRASQPLFLCTLVEELRVFGAFEGLQGHLDALLSSADLDDLYEKTLERLEANHDPVRVKKALSGLCLSQAGLTEQEVLEYSGLSYQARWSPIRLALGDALFHTAGRVRPAHEHLRKAVRDRYYPELAAEQAMRLDLARWFGERALDRRRAWEQTAQLAMAAAYDQLISVLSDRAMFGLVHRMGGNERLYRFWMDIEAATGVAASAHYRKLWSQWCVDLPIEHKMIASLRLQRFLRYCRSDDDFTLQLTQERLEDCRKAYGDSDLRYLRQLGVSAQALALHSEFLGRARIMAEQACEGIERETAAGSNVLATQLLGLGRICLKQRDAESGIAAVRRSLVLMESDEGTEHPAIIPHLNCLIRLLLLRAGKATKGDAGVLKGNSKLRESLGLVNRSLSILRISRGPEHLEWADALTLSGRLLARCQKFDMADWAVEKALEIRLRLLGKGHPLTRTSRTLKTALVEARQRMSSPTQVG